MDSETVEQFYPTSSIVVSPWIWLTLSTLVLFALLFVSFRKQRAIELYHQAKEYLLSKLASLKARSPIQLPTTTASRTPLSNPPPPPRFPRSISHDSDLSNSSSQIEYPDEHLPFSSNPSLTTRGMRYASFQRRSRSMIENLGHNLVDVGNNVVAGLGWGQQSSDDGSVGGGGLKRLLMGTRDVDRGMGRIRLGAGGGGQGQDIHENLFELGTEEEAEELSLTTKGVGRSGGLNR